MRTGSRLAAVALASGGLFAFLVEILHLTALNQADGSVFGVAWDYYPRWSIFPLLLVLYGLVGLHRHQEGRYGGLGRYGFLITFLGYSMVVIGGIWSEILIPPQHPLRFLGQLMSLLSLWVVSVGWAVWGSASLNSRSLSRWAAPIPLIIAFVWVGFRFPLHDFFSGVFWGGEGPFRYAVHALGLCLLAAALWQGDKSESVPSAEPALNRS
jgi:hypothetical protein